MNLKAITVILFFSIISVDAFSGGYAAWWQQSPGGNEVFHEGTGNGYTNGIRCINANVNGDRNGHVVVNMEEWYFYKNHIIGKFKDGSQVNFFIFNESNCRHEVYTNEKEFKTKLKEKDLKPLIWTRWHKETYGVIFIDSGNIGDMLAYSFLKLPLLILFTLFFLITLFRTKFDLNKRVNKINLIITAVLLLRIFLDFHPSSF